MNKRCASLTMSISVVINHGSLFRKVIKNVILIIDMKTPNPRVTKDALLARVKSPAPSAFPILTFPLTDAPRYNMYVMDVIFITTAFAPMPMTASSHDTHFFEADVLSDHKDGSCEYVECSTRLTLLDLAIQVVCDVATSSARETYLRSCVDFVSDAVRYAGGKLNDRTIGFVLRFYLFVFYFGASIPTTGWPFEKDWGESSSGLSEDALLSDDLKSEKEFGLIGSWYRKAKVRRVSRNIPVR